jgi:hypothetical protein
MSELPSELPALNKASTPLEAVSALAAAMRQMRHFAMQGTANEIAEACAIACRMVDELEFWEAEEKKRRERSDRAKRAAAVMAIEPKPRAPTPKPSFSDNHQGRTSPNVNGGGFVAIEREGSSANFMKLQNFLVRWGNFKEAARLHQYHAHQQLVARAKPQQRNTSSRRSDQAIKASISMTAASRCWRLRRAARTGTQESGANRS